MWGISTETISEWEVGLLYEDGRFVRTLSPGRYRLLGRPWAKAQSVTRVDTRRKVLAISGQELLTADGFSVRLNVTCDWRVVDAPTALHASENYLMEFYSAAQLALRGAVQGRTIDALLGDRAALGEEMQAALASSADRLGLEVCKVGLKDIVLPGELKKLLAKESEAVREGRAALAAVREEVATVRARANAAKLLGESPVLMRLRELETIEKVSEGAGNTVLVALPPESRVSVNV